MDLAWAEGVFRDGRPYRKEFWAQDQLSLLTFFFSSAGLEGLDDNQLGQLLVREGLIQFNSEERYCAGLPLVDDSGNDMWSVNIVVGNEDKVYVEDRRDMSPYEA